jgi:hypothetical protein
MTNIKEIYDKYLDGETITDQELNDGLNHFGIVEQYLRELGPRFHFPWKEANRVKMDLHAFKKARAKR